MTSVSSQDPTDQPPTSRAAEPHACVASETRPLGQLLAYAYDGRGRLAQVTNARGNVLRYGYFGWGGLEQVEEYLTAISTPASKTVSYAYSDAGQTTTASDSSAPGGPLLYTYAYDALDRVDTTTVHYLPGGSRVIDSDYDRFGNRRQLAGFRVPALPALSRRCRCAC